MDNESNYDDDVSGSKPEASEPNKSVRPTPSDFDSFLPWACSEFSVEYDIVISRTYLSDYVSVQQSHDKSRKKVSRRKAPSVVLGDSLKSCSIMDDQPNAEVFGKIMGENVISILTVYDSSLKLIKVKLIKNKYIPRLVMKIIGIMIPYHPSLESISITGGIQMDGVYEISKFLLVSHLTEIILDGASFPEANYYVLLDGGRLKHLSLSKCNINDTVVKMLTKKLEYPNPASKTLTALNLSTNRITDVGAMYLANMLRANRSLGYLNLSDNMITDVGAVCIYNNLIKFIVTEQELKDRKARFFQYLNEKVEFIQRAIKEMNVQDLVPKSPKRKSVRPSVAPTTPSLTRKKSKTGKLSVETKNLVGAVDVMGAEQAEILVDRSYKPFVDPYSTDNTEIRDNITFCYGNNTLCYLNLAYNNLTHISLSKLMEVLQTQSQLNRKPKGLINVMIDGNFLPKSCKELETIDSLLSAGLSAYGKTAALRKKSVIGTKALLS